MRVNMDIPRPDEVDLLTQGDRGPFGPLIILLNALTDINEWSMRQKSYVPLLKSGVRYQQEPMNLLRLYGEEFAGVDKVYERGWGDCDDLAPIYAAELRVLHGLPAKPCLKWKWQRFSLGEALRLGLITPKQIGQLRAEGTFHVDLLLMHILTAYSLDGGWSWTVCDPCKALGMKGNY